MLPVTRTGNAAHDMAAIMARVRKMSDSQLADILSGKDVSVPQFAAMTEAMGRKQLRQAVDGQQAQQQAQQPSVKDQLLAEEAGLAALPAPNMESMDMASGGIVAFENGGDVYDRWKALAADEGEGINKLLDPIYGFFTNRYGDEAKARRLEREKQTALADVANTQFADDTIDPNLKMRPVAPVAPSAPTGGPAKAPAVAAEKPAAPTGGKKAGKAEPTYDELLTRRSTDYLSPFADYTKQQRANLESAKSQGLGEALMLAGQGLLSKPTLAGGIGAGLGALAEKGAATRKELRGAEKELAEYDFNLAKAREATEKGDAELALKYKQLADLNAYHMGSLGIQGQKLGMLKDQYDMVKIPAQLSKVYADAKKEIDTAYNNMVPKSKREQYQKDIEAAYRKRAGSVGLGKYVDLYSPSMPAYNVVQSPRKGATVYDLD